MEVVLSSRKPSPKQETYHLTLPFSSLQELDRESLIFDPKKPESAGYFAYVFKGTLQTPDGIRQVVAIKALNDIGMRSSKTKEDRTRRLAKRLTRESETWGAMHHHNILRVLGVCYGPEPYIVTPWCRSGDLEKFLEKYPNMGRRQRLHLVLGAARGLQYLHTFEPSICHGDIKPRNVLVSDDENDSFICDFGLACGFEKIDQANATTGMPKGTARFSSPEQLLQGKRALAGDVYSLALLVLNVLTSLPPFYQHPNATDGRIEFLRTLDKEMTPDSNVYPALPESDPLWDLMRRCWSLDPAGRLTVTAVVEELEARLDEL